LSAWHWHAECVSCSRSSVRRRIKGYTRSVFRKLVKALIPSGVFRVIEPTGHLLEAVMWQVVLGWPARGLKVVGVTGTNGKTTTSFMIHTMLVKAGYKVGLMTTIAYGVGADIKPQMTHMTTAGTRVLLKRIKEMRAAGIEWLVLETTSHALAQNRVWGIPYSVAVMTNVTHEHLAYHGTFERYREAKVKLFRMTAANEAGLRTGIVNGDDPSAAFFAAAVPKVVRYSVKQVQSDLKAGNVHSTPEGSEFDVKYNGEDLHLKTGLPGGFNVSNALAAASVGMVLGLEGDQVRRGIAALKGVEGRMERIDEGQDFVAIVDYAHSPDSFEKLLSEMKPMVKGRMIVVFGSQGRTGDVAKRAVQGRIAGKYAHLVVVTEEDDRGENGLAIMDEIARGAQEAGKVRDRNLFLIHDRPEAMRFAVGKAKAGDTLLFLGKGHEKTIERNAEGEEPWDEMGEVSKAIKERLKATKA
jgi:UDP-N-acetylmuramoyl-L-alanyl-D-glutamate--2,6-diaminopimelate ligase